MAWVKYQDSDGLVLGVYATETAAAPGAGESREEVDPLPDDLEPFASYRASDGTYGTEPPATATADSVKSAQRQQIYDAYQWWRINGRTEHWVSLRTGAEARKPLVGTDKWAYHIVALCDRVIDADIFSGKTAAERQAFVDHAVNVLRTLGPTWYGVQAAGIDAGAGGAGNANAVAYADSTSVTDGSAIYTDICNAAGVTRSVDGTWTAIPGATIRNGFDAEDSNLGRS